MIADVLGAPVSTAERFDDSADVALFPEEEALLGRAVASRRAEFSTARLCAREALGGLGVPPVPVLPGPKREPLWPDGVVGSITHCAGYRACAVARVSDLLTVGIDAEPNAPTPDGVLGAVALPAEIARGEALSAAHPDVSWDRLLFSAKESTYKAWYPVARRWLGFEDADIVLRPDGTFTSRVLVEPPVVGGVPLDVFHGRWLCRDGLLLTTVAVPAAA
ncbi:4'-phosphopantetheinyl transferase family protein [Umezawaea beigongshangensis]|uniref:4'-phosphopantetheinyl transferase family protein n=1 Tax=Umezawaea beigongshangensis TaxID=2780383 RepID=UPI0018F13F36|nr:4'-phosphopantetheinyl transferase superfamily protein [Umezawaea beigongshangensis]